jgi:hypothetical protein
MPEGRVWIDADYRLNGEQTNVSIDLDALPVQTLRQGSIVWPELPAFLDRVRSGLVSGQVNFRSNSDETPTDLWAGKLVLSKAAIAVPGLAVPLANAQGHFNFSGSTFDLERLTGKLGEDKVAANFRYDPGAQFPQRLSVKVASLDVSDVQAILSPSLRPFGLLARLGVVRRTVPDWMAGLNLQGDVAVDQLTVDGKLLGALHTQVRWEAASVLFPRLRIDMPDGVARGTASVNIRAGSPKYSLQGTLSGLPWHGGILSATGTAQAIGFGSDLLRSLEASGTFSGQDLKMSSDDSFSKLDGSFALSFADGWPDLRVSNLSAFQDGEDWSGQAASQSDGTLILDLNREGRQRKVVSTLGSPEAPVAPSVARSE